MHRLDNLSKCTCVAACVCVSGSKSWSQSPTHPPSDLRGGSERIVSPGEAVECTLWSPSKARSTLWTRAGRRTDFIRLDERGPQKLRDFCSRVFSVKGTYKKTVFVSPLVAAWPEGATIASVVSCLEENGRAPHLTFPSGPALSSFFFKKKPAGGRDPRSLV